MSAVMLRAAEAPSLRPSMARKEQKGAMQVDTMRSNARPVESTQICLKTTMRRRKRFIAGCT